MHFTNLLLLCILVFCCCFFTLCIPQQFTYVIKLRMSTYNKRPMRAPGAVFFLLEYTQSVSWLDVVRGD